MKTTRITTTTRVSICDALVGGRRMTPQHHPKIGILLTNSGIFCDLRNFDFVFWKLRNSFLLARGPCRPCQQNFDLKFDFDVSTESGILQIQKKVDLGEKFRFCVKTCPRMERVSHINSIAITIKALPQNAVCMCVFENLDIIYAALDSTAVLPHMHCTHASTPGHSKTTKAPPQNTGVLCL